MAGAGRVIQPRNYGGPFPLPLSLLFLKLLLTPVTRFYLYNRQRRSFGPNHLQLTHQKKPEAPKLPGIRPRARLRDTGYLTLPAPSGDRDSTFLET